MTGSPSTTCNACQWWVPPPDTQPIGAPGQCRRYPPSGAPQVAASAWPLVFGTDWCGDFTAASTVHEVNASYTWVATAPPPLSGEFRTNSRNWTSAAQLAFWTADHNSQDLTATFGAMATGDGVRAQQGTNWHSWSLSAPPTQNADTTWTMNVTSTGSGGGTPSVGVATTCTFTLAA